MRNIGRRFTTTWIAVAVVVILVLPAAAMVAASDDASADTTTSSTMVEEKSTVDYVYYQDDENYVVFYDLNLEGEENDVDCELPEDATVEVAMVDGAEGEEPTVTITVNGAELSDEDCMAVLIAGPNGQINHGQVVSGMVHALKEVYDKDTMGIPFGQFIKEFAKSDLGKGDQQVKPDKDDDLDDDDEDDGDNKDKGKPENPGSQGKDKKNK